MRALAPLFWPQLCLDPVDVDAEPPRLLYKNYLQEVPPPRCRPFVWLSDIVDWTSLFQAQPNKFRSRRKSASAKARSGSYLHRWEPKLETPLPSSLRRSSRRGTAHLKNGTSAIHTGILLAALESQDPSLPTCFGSALQRLGRRCVCLPSRSSAVHHIVTSTSS